MAPHLLLGAATLPDTITFAIAAAICLVGSLGVVISTHPVHSALCLVMTLFGVAVLFVEENAQFLAAVQVIVYAGAIVVLFLFVIMLLGVDRAEAISADPLRGQRAIALLLGVLTLVEVVLLSRGRWPIGAHSTAGSLQGTTQPNVNVLGRSIFTTYLLPFEVTSALLVIAIVGAVVLARRPGVRVPSDAGGREIGEVPMGPPGDTDDGSAEEGDEADFGPDEADDAEAEAGAGEDAEPADGAGAGVGSTEGSHK